MMRPLIRSWSPRSLSTNHLGIYSSCGIGNLRLFVGRRSLASQLKSHALKCAVRRFVTTSARQDESECTDFYSYTSGRFLFNKSKRLEERHVEFNVAELHAAIQQCLGHAHGPVAGMSKMAEGGFNRVFLVQMKDGFEVVAKIPYRLAVPAFYATASEAATLTFLKGNGIPVPEVYAYCADANNPVGCEYIILEKVTGVSAVEHWSDLTNLEIRRLAVSISELEGKLFALPFAATGSLYYKSDIPESQQAPLFIDDTTSHEAQRFCIGPIADYMFWYGRRASLSLDRGPWTDPVHYLQATARKEIVWAKGYGRPTDPKFPHRVLEFGIQQPADYIQSLEDYLTLTPHLLPEQKTHAFNQPVICHPDLTPANMFIDPSTGRIAHLIDWQHTIIQPLILAAGAPPAFENPDVVYPGKPEEPELPDNMDTLSKEDQFQVREYYRRKMLFHCYRVVASVYNVPHHKAMLDRVLLVRKTLVDYAGRQWSRNNFTLRGAIARMIRYFHLLPDAKGKTCPLPYENAELERTESAEEEWTGMNILMNDCRRRACNMTEDGWVRNEDYENAQQELRNIKAEVIRQCDGDASEERMVIDGWPFCDHEEED